ncbi:MAG: xylulokinase [Solirubrobacterales bacterium]
MGQVVCGVDSSTRSTKVLAVDVDEGEVVGRGQAPHLVSGEGGARVSDPEAWTEALAAALAQTGWAGQMAAIAVAGQQHGLVVLDAGGRALRPAPLWNDTTNAEDLAVLIEQVGSGQRWTELAGSVPTTSFTVAHWAKLRRADPAVLDDVARVCLPHDFLTLQLCGRLVSDRGDASGTGWWSPARDGYADEVLELPQVGLDVEMLPEILIGSAPAGELDAAIASRLGLRAGIPVAAGSGDNMAAALGLGLGVGEVAISLGTSGTVFAVAEDPVEDPSGVIAGFADAGRRFLPLACALNATMAVDRVATMLGIDRENVAPAGEVVVLPYFDGERTPAYPHAAASFTGLRHTTEPGQILQATYDGVVESLLWALDRLSSRSGGLGEGAPLLLVGGGARGLAWRRTVQALSGRPVVVPEECEAVALGAAALAAAAINGDEAELRARQWASRRPAQSLEPVPRDEERLARIAAVRGATGALNDGAGSTPA